MDHASFTLVFAAADSCKQLLHNLRDHWSTTHPLCSISCSCMLLEETPVDRPHTGQGGQQLGRGLCIPRAVCLWSLQQKQEAKQSACLLKAAVCMTSPSPCTLLL